MSKIVVAIDFSESSLNAFVHAMSIAKACGSDLMLVWVRKSAAEKDKFESGEVSNKDVEAQMKALVEKYQPELPGNKISYKIRTGKVYKEITDEARENKAMLIATGTHGASVFIEFWIGSNANKIVSLAPCPVLTIRAGININRPLTKIVMPIDNSMETRQKASFTGYFAKKFNAEVHILAMYTSTSKSVRQTVNAYAGQVADYFDKEEIKYVIATKEGDNIADGMIEYAKSVEANLISIMSQQETATSNLWMGSFAQQIINRSPLPVLCMRPMETLAAGLGF